MKTEILRPLLIAAVAALVPACGGGSDGGSPPPTPVPWTQILNPSGGVDTANASVLTASGLVVGGGDVAPGDRQWRIELRSAQTGDLVASFGTGGVVVGNFSAGDDQVSAVAADATHLYAGGWVSGAVDASWRIEKRSLATGALDPAFGTAGAVTSNPTGAQDMIRAIAVDASDVYAAGFEDGPGAAARWRIEKRTRATGALVAAFGTAGVVTADPSAGSDFINGVLVDAGFLYVVGSDFGGGGARWRIEKRLASDGSLVAAFGTAGVVTVDPSGTDEAVYALATDGANLYLAGSENENANAAWRIEKRDNATGALVASFGTAGVVSLDHSAGTDIAYAITIDAGSLWAGGHDSVPGDTRWRIERRALTTGTLVASFGTAGVRTDNFSANNDEHVYALANDAGFVYAVGIDEAPGAGNTRIHLEKIAK